jgi:anaerobic magnesium-protoporphyrin IX monomethyl ester cyclase
MADVLLTHSNHLAYDRKQVRKMEPYPPLGTLYAAGLLRAHGISVAAFDSMLQEPESGLKEALRTHKPKIVAIYEDDFNFLTKMCLTRMRELAWKMMEIIRSHGAQVVVHGSDATDHAAEFLQRGAVCVLEGEAEQRFCPDQACRIFQAYFVPRAGRAATRSKRLRSTGSGAHRRFLCQPET